MLALDAMVDQDLFICPRCGSRVRAAGGVWHCTNADCNYADEPFPVVGGKPALVDFDNSVIDADRLLAAEGASEVRRTRLSRLRSRFTQPPNTAAPAAVAQMLGLLRIDEATRDRRPRIVVIGGGTIGAGLDKLYSDPAIDLVAFDVYVSPVVQFIGDGHAIPLADASIDGVVVQAVLEHVLQPEGVAQEIHRILRSGGIVYADTPFMQQVHEGPYDFTRFTDSGHRYLFRSFERIDSGGVAGAGTALLWSITFFIRALTRSVRLGNIVALCFFWLGYTDRILDPRHSLDAASSVFFLGRKTAIAMKPVEIIAYYQGGHRGTPSRRSDTAASTRRRHQ